MRKLKKNNIINATVEYGLKSVYNNLILFIHN